MLLVMRACEGCRRRKIKCDAATTNTWPCAACIRLKLQCVRPNGFDGSTETQVYETDTEPSYESEPAQDAYQQQAPLSAQQMLAAAPRPSSAAPYAVGTSYGDTAAAAAAAALYQSVSYSDLAPNLHYTTVPPAMGLAGPSYSGQGLFQQSSQPDSPPDSLVHDQFAQGDLADLLGSLKVNEAGTGE